MYKVSMGIDEKNIRKMKSFVRSLRRSAELPRGKTFFRYFENRVALMIALRRRRLRLPHPISIMLELTTLCQLKCITCPQQYAMGREMDRGHMDLESAERLFDQNYMYLNVVGLTGLGETLLYPHLVEFVQYLRSKNEFVGISLSTTAMKPDAPKIVNAIADQIDSLQISIDGCGEVFEKIKRNATWEKYLANPKEIAKIVDGRRAKILLNMVVLDITMIRWLISLGSRKASKYQWFTSILSIL